jgi:hypothetical protein
MKYSELRTYHYTGQRKHFESCNEDMDDWLTSPYTCFKSRIYLELSVILVFFLQHTKVHPNHLSLLYIFNTIIACILFSTNIYILMIISLTIYFFNGTLDWADGLLARINNLKTNIGAVLDPWGSFISSISFRIGIGFYLYHQIGFIYIIIMIFILVLDLTRIKSYYNNMLLEILINNKDRINDFNVNPTGNNINQLKDKDFALSHIIKNVIKKFFNFFNDRARMTDLVCLILLIEIINNNIFASHYIYMIFFLQSIFTFLVELRTFFREKFPFLTSNLKFGKYEKS